MLTLEAAETMNADLRWTEARWETESRGMTGGEGVSDYSETWRERRGADRNGFKRKLKKL